MLVKEKVVEFPKNKSCFCWRFLHSHIQCLKLSFSLFDVARWHQLWGIRLQLVEVSLKTAQEECSTAVIAIGVFSLKNKSYPLCSWTMRTNIESSFWALSRFLRLSLSSPAPNRLHQHVRESAKILLQRLSFVILVFLWEHSSFFVGVWLGEIICSTCACIVDSVDGLLEKLLTVAGNMGGQGTKLTHDVLCRKLCRVFCGELQWELWN